MYNRDSLVGMLTRRGGGCIINRPSIPGVVKSLSLSERVLPLYLRSAQKKRQYSKVTACTF